MTLNKQMQTYETITMDARTFKQIWSTLGRNERIVLNERLIHNMNVTRQTVNNWSLGKTCPHYDSAKKEVARIVNQTLGINTNYRTLFPV